MSHSRTLGARQTPYHCTVLSGPPFTSFIYFFSFHLLLQTGFKALNASEAALRPGQGLDLGDASCPFTPQVSTTVETFQDLSLPIPSKEDLAKLHSPIYQNSPAKPGACRDSYTPQGWLAFLMEYIRR